MTTVLDMMKARGEKEPETQTDWEAYKAKREARRQKNYENAISLLRAAQISFVKSTTQLEGRQILFVAKLNGSEIVYFPEEGKWYDGQEKAQYGIKNLIRYVKMGL